MPARRLTTDGIEQFGSFLSHLKTEPSLDAPMELLTSSSTSAPIDVDVDAEPRQFHSRLEVAEHLHRLLKMVAANLRTDTGFWTWLALCWFESLCPSQNGKWQPGDRNRWIADLEDQGSPADICWPVLTWSFVLIATTRRAPCHCYAGPPNSRDCWSL